MMRSRAQMMGVVLHYFGLRLAALEIRPTVHPAGKQGLKR